MRRSIMGRRSRRKIKQDFELQLTSMMDMLIILLVFLLKSYSTSTVSFATSPSIRLPSSNAVEQPANSTNLVIEPTAITVDGQKIIDFAASVSAATGSPVTAENATYEIDRVLMADSGRRILPLYDALVKVREQSELLASKASWHDKDGKTIEPPKFSGTLIIHADKAVRYDLLRKVMYTAGAAQFKVFKLVTSKKEGA